MKTNSITFILIVTVLALFMANCGNCDDGTIYEDEQVQTQTDTIS